MLAADILYRMDAFLGRLLDANRQINLTAVRDREEAWHRHIVDSLTVLRFLEAGPQRLVDVGSGGGVPGIPLAIAKPDLEVMLVEATSKKAGFLSDICREMGRDRCKVLAERAERVGHLSPHREGYDVAVCRAVGPLREIAEYLLPLVRVGGVAVAFKGPSIEAEIDLARDAVSKLGGGSIRIEPAYPPHVNNRSTLVFIKKRRETPRLYPRAPGTPKRASL